MYMQGCKLPDNLCSTVCRAYRTCYISKKYIRYVTVIGEMKHVSLKCSLLIHITELESVAEFIIEWSTSTEVCFYISETFVSLPYHVDTGNRATSCDYPPSYVSWITKVNGPWWRPDIDKRFVLLVLYVNLNKRLINHSSLMLWHCKGNFVW